MADKKISELNNATLPLAGTELIPIVQGGETVKVEVSEIQGSQTLAQTLTNGNTTGGENISISDGDAIILDNGSKIIKGTTNAGLGGSKGIALRCAVDYELKWEAGRLYVMEQDGFTIREVSHNFTTAPTVNDDTTKGFAIGSRWILDNGNIYICEDDNIGVAVWELQTAGVPDATTVVKGIIKLAGDLGGSASLPTVPALGNKVDKITPITGATKTKVTYNTQGQVTAGADATTADIADSVNKRYQTDAQETVNDATSSIQTQLNGKVNNTGAETIAGAKTFSSNLTIPATGTPLILSVSSGGSVSGLDTTTYPSLTELATVKGVTSAIQTQIELRQPYTIARTTTAITFDVPAIYNSFSSPQTGTLTSNLTSPLAKIGVVQVIYLNVATFPTLAGWVNIGSRAFQPSVVNIIYAKWSEGSRVEYWISKATA